MLKIIFYIMGNTVQFGAKHYTCLKNAFKWKSWAWKQPENENQASDLTRLLFAFHIF